MDPSPLITRIEPEPLRRVLCGPEATRHYRQRPQLEPCGRRQAVGARGGGRAAPSCADCPRLSRCRGPLGAGCVPDVIESAIAQVRLERTHGAVSPPVALAGCYGLAESLRLVAGGSEPCRQVRVCIRGHLVAGGSRFRVNPPPAARLAGSVPPSAVRVSLASRRRRRVGSDARGHPC